MFEKTWTVYQPVNSGPMVVPLDIQLPGGSPTLEMQTWTSPWLNTNVYIFEGDIDLNSAQQRLTSPDHLVDCLMVVGAGVVWRRIPSDISRRLTFLFSAAASATDGGAVQLKIREIA